MTHGRLKEANDVTAEIEHRVAARDPGELKPITGWPLSIRSAAHVPGPVELIKTLFVTYPRRAFLGLMLMAAQAFLFNAIFFTYALVLNRFYGIPSQEIGFHVLIFAAGNFLGPLLLGPLFDSVGRRLMISGTYIISGILLTIAAWLFSQGYLSANEQSLAWSIVFFFASAAASSAYLTVGESFPLEIRALAIAVFYALATALGGGVGPWLLGSLIGTGARAGVADGYYWGAGWMLVAGITELLWGLSAERKSLEELAVPLSATETDA